MPRSAARRAAAIASRVPTGPRMPAQPRAIASSTAATAPSGSPFVSRNCHAVASADASSIAGRSSAPTAA